MVRIPWRLDPHRFSDVRRIWEQNRCVEPGTISLYRYWICRFFDYCRIQRLDEHQELTRVGSRRFALWWRSQGSPRGGQLPSTLNSSRSAIRAWSFALGVLGVKVPSWESPATPPPLSALMAVFAGYLNDVRGNPPQTVHKRLTHMAMFSAHCRKRRRAIQRARLTDIDDFIVACRQRYAPRTVADICSTLRVFQRFLCSTGRSGHDLSGSVLSPIIRVNERPHRALPWKEVQRILRAVDRSRPTGRRDYAILLMMINAAVLGTTAISLSSAWAYGEVRGWPHSLQLPVRKAPGFYVIYLACVAVAAGLVLIPRAPLQLIILGVQVLAGVMLPSAIIFLQLLLNDKELLGGYANKPWNNWVNWTIIIVLFALSLILAAQVAAPNLFPAAQGGL